MQQAQYGLRGLAGQQLDVPHGQSAVQVQLAG
jgi:hypothetical protein